MASVLKHVKDAIKDVYNLDDVKKGFSELASDIKHLHGATRQGINYLLDESKKLPVSVKQNLVNDLPKAIKTGLNEIPNALGSALAGTTEAFNELKKGVSEDIPKHLDPAKQGLDYFLEETKKLPVSIKENLVHELPQTAKTAFNDLPSSFDSVVKKTNEGLNELNTGFTEHLPRHIDDASNIAKNKVIDLVSEIEVPEVVLENAKQALEYLKQNPENFAFGGFIVTLVAVAFVIFFWVTEQSLISLIRRLVNAIISYSVKVCDVLYAGQTYPIAAGNLTATILVIVVVVLLQPRWLVVKMMGNTFVQKKIFNNPMVRELTNIVESLFSKGYLKYVGSFLHLCAKLMLSPWTILSTIFASPKLMLMIGTVSLLPPTLAYIFFRFASKKLRTANDTPITEQVFTTTIATALGYLTIFLITSSVMPSLSSCFTGPNIDGTLAMSIAMSAIVCAGVVTMFSVRNGKSTDAQVRTTTTTTTFVTSTVAALLILLTPWASEKSISMRRLSFQHAV